MSGEVLLSVAKTDSLTPVIDPPPPQKEVASWKLIKWSGCLESAASKGLQSFLNSQRLQLGM